MIIRGQKLAGLCLAGAILLFGQDWTTATSLPKVDFAGLTPAQTARALKLLRQQDCSCRCGMKVAECRMKDPSCAYSRGMADETVAAIRAGKNDQQVLAAVAASDIAKGPADHSKLLEDPVNIPVANAPVRGPATAPVTLVEFSDFQCPFCIAATPQLESVLKAYPSQVKLIFKEFPLDTHAQAPLAAAAALSAQKQGKFWPMYDGLFAQKGNLSRRGVLALAMGIGLDMKQFQADLDSAAIKKAVERDMDDGEHIGVDSTPTLFMNGQRYNGPVTLAALKPVLDQELKHKPAKTPAANR
ncbi:MAG TPA: thioredoxin domain-containing protein [Bryobacteraceae bacterium]|nr:thioredoxin domain-containing protein [Bryobacteraceae bacterium]